MKTYSQSLNKTAVWLLALASVAAAGRLGARGVEDQSGQSSSATVTITTSDVGTGGAVSAAASGPNAIVIRSIEQTTGDEQAVLKDQTWLGVSVEEGSEALASQLDLAPGAGLVVTYVAPESPAANAGLQKHDVLVELEGQLLVVPAQLRKLVRARKESDTIELSFYRAGKKQTASATLGKAPAGFSLLDDGHPVKGDLHIWSDSFAPDTIRQHMKVLRDSAGNVTIDQKKVQEEVRRSVEKIRKDWQDGLRHSTNLAWAPATKALRELKRSGVLVDNNASVTVRSTGQAVKSIVKADDSGTIVVVSNPKPHLTAHDKEGKLLFDGEIDTPEQRAKVPRELWEKVEPLLEKIAPEAEEEHDDEHAPSKGESSIHVLPPAPTPRGVAPTL